LPEMAAVAAPAPSAGGVVGPVEVVEVRDERTDDRLREGLYGRAGI
jgi:hypothetical protein